MSFFAISKLFGKYKPLNFSIKWREYVQRIHFSAMFPIPFLSEAILKWIKKHPLDDQIDRINYFTTPILLLFFSLIVSTKQYIGSPIQCWIPQEFSGAWEEYAENFCFVQGTYYFAPNKTIDFDQEKRRANAFGYYQWVPAALAIQALFFCLPNWIWKKLCGNSEFEGILKKADSLCIEETKNEIIIKAKFLFDNYLSPDLEKSLMCHEGKTLNSDCKRIRTQHMAWKYMLIKILYNANIALQFYLLSLFVAKGDIFWGWSILSDIFNNEDSEIFPRTSLCDFSIREMGNVHNHTIQCVLMVNMFNEKIYLFLWIWLILIGLFTLVNTTEVFLLLMFKRKWFFTSADGYKKRMCADQILFLRFLAKIVPKSIYNEIYDVIKNDIS